MDQASPGRRPRRKLTRLSVALGVATLLGGSFYNFKAHHMPATQAGVARSVTLGVMDTAGAAAGFFVFGPVGEVIGAFAVQGGMNSALKKAEAQTTKSPAP